jgi:cyclic-di-GMP-binding biofilm dispersal mediator protein
MAAYSAAKTALHAFGVAAGRELRRSGVRLIDARPGHTETDLSKHPLAGVAPAFPQGLPPVAVVRRIVDAIASDEKDLPSTAFHGLG